MSKYKVVITDREYESIDQELEILSDIGADVYDYQYKEEGDVIRVAQDCDALIVQYSNISKKVIDSLSKCKIISKYAIGLDTIDLKAATEKGICVANVPDYCIDEVSTHAVALLLDVTRKISLMNNDLKNRLWDYKVSKPIYNLRGRAIGVIGFGKIPKEFVKKIMPYGMRVLVYDPYVTKEVEKEYGVELKTFEEIVRESDYISIHVPLLDSTKHMFNKNVFRNMKRTAFIINVGRGAVINEGDLIEALQNGEIAGAGLDVFENEPVSRDNPLLSMDNVVVTPHVAWYSEDSQRRLQKSVAEEVARVLTGTYPRNLANKEVKEKIKLNEFR